MGGETFTKRNLRDTLTNCNTRTLGESLYKPALKKSVGNVLFVEARKLLSEIHYFSLLLYVFEKVHIKHIKEKSIKQYK